MREPIDRIWRPSPERQRDLNLPDLGADRHTHDKPHRSTLISAPAKASQSADSSGKTGAIDFAIPRSTCILVPAPNRPRCQGLQH